MKWQVEAAVRLIDEGNTIPFIARYRKEATGTLDDEQLRKLSERLIYLRNLEEKKSNGFLLGTNTWIKQAGMSWDTKGLPTCSKTDYKR